jgi:hypothetical protein
MRERDDQRLRVDLALEVAGVYDVRAARLLCVPDLPDRRELDFGEDDLPAVPVEPEPAGERADGR